MRRWEIAVLLAIIAVAAVLRFAGIQKLEYFTYDQARDALAVKRIVADGRLRLLGTQTSMPGMHLPPFYYYTIAPILWLAQLNPVAIDCYSAVIGVLFIPLIYFVANRFFGSPAGLFSASLAAVSPLLVELTRRAWNPNTLPFFILIAFYFLYRYFILGRAINLFWAFTFYGYCLSLHFGAWTLLPLFIFSWFHLLTKKERGFKVFWAVAAPLVLILFISPVIMFDFRHQHLLFNDARDYFLAGGRLGFSFWPAVESFFSSVSALFLILISGNYTLGHGAPSEFSGKFIDLFGSLKPISVVAHRPFAFGFADWGILVCIFIVLSSLYLTAKSLKEKNKKLSWGLGLLWIWLVWGIFISRFFKGGFFFFYYLYLFPIPLLLYGFMMHKIWQKKNLRIISAVLAAVIFLYHLSWTKVYVGNWRDINDLRGVAAIISENVTSGNSFNIVTIRRDNEFMERNAVDYRYFVEAFEKKIALDWYPEDYQKAGELFVVDETGQTDILSSEIMELQRFGPGEIIGRWETKKGIVIYKISKNENE